MIYDMKGFWKIQKLTDDIVIILYSFSVYVN